MNCEEALSLLYEMIDKEASEVDTKEVQEHLHKCNDCFQKYRVEQSIHAFIQERLQNGAKVDAHTSLRMKIRLRLDEIDGELDEQVQEAPSDRGTPRPFKLPAVALAAAAAVIILISAGYFGAHFYNHQQLYLPLEQAHWADESNLAEPWSESDMSLALSQADERYHYQLRPTVDDYHLIGGHEETVMGQSMMHYVYHNGASKVSVFLAPAEFFARYADSDMEQVVRDTLTMFDHKCQGCRLVFHRIGGTLVITASTDPKAELLDFIPGYAAI